MHMCVSTAAPPSYPANVHVITGSNESVISWERPDFMVTIFGKWITCMGRCIILHKIRITRY